jgi:TolB-like protein
MGTAALEPVYQFEGYTLDLVRGALLDPKGTEVPIRAKSFQLLRLFVVNAGRLLDRDTINHAIWADVVVTDDAITQCVRDIRRALGDKTQAVIKTVPRRGYVFAANVAKASDGRPPVPARAEVMLLPDGPSIAVLPFANLSADPEQEYFSDGVADDIITELSRDRALFVIARNSSFTYRGRSIDVKQVGRELGVRYVVEGSVRRAAGRVRVTVQLIDATTGSHVWADRYDREVEHVFAVQDEVAEAVATAIRPAVGYAEQRRILRKPSGSLSAWEEYQRGLWHLAKGSLADDERALGCFRRAAETDPGFASAFVGSALVYQRSGLYHGLRPIAEAGTLALQEARQALALDPTDSEALAVLAAALATAGDLHSSLDYAERALACNRNSASAHWVKSSDLVYLGRPLEGREEALVSLRLNPRDPGSSMAASNVTVSYFVEGNYAATVDSARRYLAEYPAYHAPRRWLVAALGLLDRHEEAKAALREWLAVAPGLIDIVVRNRPPYIRREYHALVVDGMRKAGWQG